MGQQVQILFSSFYYCYTLAISNTNWVNSLGVRSIIYQKRGKFMSIRKMNPSRCDILHDKSLFMPEKNYFLQINYNINSLNTVTTSMNYPQILGTFKVHI
ncbi:hypothetical protein PR729_02515 [Providencia rettgeri]|nr:hypothetical protein PR729_13755 [Providencia rettgeri]OBY37703.1 hypothetical protein PR729_02515 [Providencia rettgeri]